ncbi:kinase-like protein [Sporormia fimetaria CBS 119925]|uniref:Kinase-like protein n=1 Tax=Sporormia fimetaria CBS 119925 TaxID=1340428 RepID=A0A6A6VE88_9PLEO|nr:kinase-like protein [Sporormia fimetaria CBS 119925]
MASESEGEIVERPEKAKLASSRRQETAIDNSSSRGSGHDRASGRNGYSYRGLSRSPSPYRARSDKSPSPYRRGRSRSPSPYRRDRDVRARQEKAPRPPKRRGSPPRHGRPDKRVFGEQDRTSDSRSSAPSHRSRLDQEQREARKDEQRPVPRPISYADNDRFEAVPSFQPPSRQSDKHAVDNASRQAKHYGTTQSKRELVVNGSSPLVERPAPRHVPPPDNQGKVEKAAVASTDEDVSLEFAKPEKDVIQETREEKRRRWAAIRAQRASDSGSLLQHAIIHNASETGTPNTGSPAPQAERSVSPISGSPSLRDFDSAPPSPDMMVIDKEDGTRETVSPRAEDFSANYDPTQDMLNDRARAEQKMQVSGMSASAYDETNPAFLSTHPADKTDAIKPKRKKKKDFDMFASDDEDEVEDEEADDGEEVSLTKGTVLDAKLLDNWDDPDGYYKLIPHELVGNNRYRIVRALGKGVYANVAAAEDVQAGAGKLVAIKFIRRNDALKRDSQKEMNVLRRLNESDPQDKRNIVRLLGSFDHKGHLSIVFEHLSKNLRDLLKEDTSGHGLSLQAVKTYARQMFTGLKHLQDNELIHADLKPDNILVSADKKLIKICDFGTACEKRAASELGVYVASRFYRAPEIILGMEAGYGIDMWAVGCTIYELWTGKILFRGDTNNQMVKAFMECLGWPSEKYLKKGMLSGDHFEAGPPLKFISREVDAILKTPIIRKIEQQRMSGRPLKSRVQEAGHDIAANGPSSGEINDLADLLVSCLNWNPEKRIQPKDAYHHKLFGAKLAPRTAVVKPNVPKRGVGPRK